MLCDSYACDSYPRRWPDISIKAPARGAFFGSGGGYGCSCSRPKRRTRRGKRERARTTRGATLSAGRLRGRIRVRFDPARLEAHGEPEERDGGDLATVLVAPHHGSTATCRRRHAAAMSGRGALPTASQECFVVYLGILLVPM